MGETTSEEYRKAMENMKKFPELDKYAIDRVLVHQGDAYFAGGDIFGRVTKEGKLIKILTEEQKLPGTDKSFIDLLIDGRAYNIAESPEYPNWITLVTNATGPISILYNPSFNEIYITPTIAKKAYRIDSDEQISEIGIPEFAKEAEEAFKEFIEPVFFNNPDTK